MKHAYIVISIIITLGATLATSYRKKNSPPFTPKIPTGPNLVLLSDTAKFTSSTYDPDGDDVAIRFSWGDGDTSAWSDYLVFYHEQVTMSHIYDSGGVYHVAAQAKDIHNARSGWSRGHVVTVSAVELIWTFGGSDDDRGKSVQQTSDGGYIIVGSTKSYGAGGSDIYLIKTDANGYLLWEKQSRRG